MNDSATNTSTTHQNVYTTSASAFQMILPILRVSSKMKHCIHLSERKVLSFQFKPLPTRNITYTWQGKKKIHTNPLTQSRLYTILHTDVRSFHKQKFEVWQQRRFCTQNRFCTEVHTEKPLHGAFLHKEELLHGSFYTEQPLHRAALTQ